MLLRLKKARLTSPLDILQGTKALQGMQRHLQAVATQRNLC